MSRLEKTMINDPATAAWRELKQNRTRTLTVMTGYAIAVALMVASAALLLFSRVAENKVLGATGTHFVTWMPNCGDITSLSEEEIAKLAKGIIPAKCKELCQNCTGCNKKPIDLLNEGFIINTNTTRLLSLELVNKIRRLATVKDASGYLLFRFRDPKSARLFSAGGFDPGSTAVETTCCSRSDLVAGEFLTPGAGGKIMLEQGFATNMNLVPGAKFTIADEQFEVAAIVNSGARPGKADVYMLFADAERVINRRIQNPLFQEANVILIEAIDASRHDQAIADVKSLVQSEAIVTYGCYKPAAEAMGMNEKSVWLFMLLVAAGAVIFAVKAQWTSVIERRRNIAILKAIGWTDRVIVMQLLTESLIQSVTGCLAGAVAAILLLITIPVSSILGIDAEAGSLIDPTIIVIILLFAIISGAVAGLLPVLITIRQRPAEVLRRN